MDWTKVPEALERLLKSGVQYGIVLVLLAAGVFWWDGQQPAGMHLKDVGAWAYWLAVVTLVLGAVVSAVSLGSLAFNEVGYLWHRTWRSEAAQMMRP